MSKNQKEIKAGWYYAAKFRGHKNGDLIVGCVKSVRNTENGDVIVDNWIKGDTSTFKGKNFRIRCKRISKPQAMKLKRMWLETRDKAKVREHAVDAPEFGEKPVKNPKKAKQQVLPGGGVYIPKEDCATLLPVLEKLMKLMKGSK